MKFADALTEVKKLAGGEYCVIEYKIISYGEAGDEQKCAVYVHRHGWRTAATWEAAIGSLREKMAPTPATDADAPGEEIGGM